MGGAGSYLVAFGGGLVSFLSPCVLPLVPVYLSMITGLEVAEIQEGAPVHLARIARDMGGFIAAVFIVLGLSASTLGRAAFANRATLTRVSGLIVVAMALFGVGSLVLQAPWLFTQKRFHPRVSHFGRLAAPVTGAAFGFGWTPCIGPVLTSVLGIAATQGQAARGAR
jgi:cytochrome c-type biogenesis protein